MLNQSGAALKNMRVIHPFTKVVGLLFLSVLLYPSCSTDWGKQDPAAGNQTYPSRQVVTTYDFEYSDEKPEFSDIDKTNSVCEVVDDDSLGSNVLHLSGEGYARVVNPFNSVKLQNGAAITFYLKLDSADLDRPLFAFGGESDSAKFYFTPNGQMVYSDSTKLQSLNLNENDPSTVTTGMLTTGKWHFVALQVTTTGYQFYVDGNKSVSGAQTSTSATDFSYETLISCINNSPYMYIGTKDEGDEHNGICFDDITLVRNQMQESDWNKKPGVVTTTSKVYIPVGSADCTSAWWTEFSDYFTISENATFHTQFINHTSGANNWNNWNLVVTTDDDRNGTSYAEYFVLRSDLYGWGNSDFNLSNITSEGYDDWETFRQNMEGAVVDVTVARSGSTVNVTAVATCDDGTTYTENYTQECGTGTQNIRAFFVVDNSYLQIDPEQTYIGNKFTSGSYLVGNADFSSTWWTAFSEYYNFDSSFGSEDNPYVFHFINNQTGKGNNWNNWLLVCTNGVERDGTGYSEHFVLRSDAYGWGDSDYNADNINFNGYDFSTGEYVTQMHGAECWVGVYRSGNTVYMETMQKQADGTWFPLYQFSHDNVTGTVGFFLTAELASLDMRDVAYYPYFKYIGQTE